MKTLRLFQKSKNEFKTLGVKFAVPGCICDDDSCEAKCGGSDCTGSYYSEKRSMVGTVEAAVLQVPV